MIFTSKSHNPDRQSGFTLTELLVVLVIMGLLVGLVGPRVVGYLSSSKTDVAKIQIEKLRTAVELYVLDVGALPSTDQGLKALVTAPSGVDGWNGPYLREGGVPEDPWGTAYLYSADADSGRFTLVSFGADGAEGGDGNNADIRR